MFKYLGIGIFTASLSFIGAKVGLFGYNHIKYNFIVKGIFNDWALTRYEVFYYDKEDIRKAYDHTVKGFIRPIRKKWIYMRDNKNGNGWTDFYWN